MLSALLLLFGLAMVIQWIAFVPAFLRQTERFYDLTGSLTYLLVVATACAMSEDLTLRSGLLAAAVAIWAIRLGSFLFARVHKHGDGRFDEIKPNPLRFLVAWTLQGLWVFLTTLGASIGILQGGALSWSDGLGLGIWAAGFAIEVVSDEQKRRFKNEHPERFINVGLWAWSRHPNYFGEILLWTGIFITGLTHFSGWQWAAVASPLFVTFLLTRVSGIPMVEARADARYGQDPDYVRYRDSTPVLMLRPPRT